MPQTVFFPFLCLANKAVHFSYDKISLCSNGVWSRETWPPWYGTVSPVQIHLVLMTFLYTHTQHTILVLSSYCRELKHAPHVWKSTHNRVVEPSFCGMTRVCLGRKYISILHSQLCFYQVIKQSNGDHSFSFSAVPGTREELTTV